MTTLAPSRAWKLRQGLALSWQLWDDEYVVFDEEWGDTHLLSFLAGETLKRLEQAPADATTIAHRIASSVEQDPDADLVGYVERVLEDCRALGLIEPESE